MMICGNFSEGMGKRLEIRDVDRGTFSNVLEYWIGKDGMAEMESHELQQLIVVADRFQMTEVVAALEEVVLGKVKVENCWDILKWSSEMGIRQLQEAALSLAAEKFEEMVVTAGFMDIEEAALGALLDDDGLIAKNEEAVWEALARWMRAEEGHLRGRGLLGKVRFPLMDEGFLASRAHDLLPAEHADWVEGLVEEAMLAKRALQAGQVPLAARLLGPRALAPRARRGVDWAACADGGERRLAGHTAGVVAVAECEGRVCSASLDGTIWVWGAATRAPERRLLSDPDACANALAAWGGRLVSGHDDGSLRVWDVRTGVCEQALEGHASFVLALAACGPARLASGSADRTVRLWAAGAAAAAPWACERTLVGHAGGVKALAAWGGKVLSGSADATIRVWDAATGAHDATLAGHADEVYGLAVHGDRLLSAAQDGAIREWAAGAWAPLRAVEAYPRGGGQFPRCLAVSGARLVSGSWAAFGDSHTEVRVWDLATLRCERALRQPVGDDVSGFVVAEGELWAGVGEALVVWGRR